MFDCEIAELRAQLIDKLDRGSIQHSTVGHPAAEVFARKPEGLWRICYDYRGLDTITRPAVEPLPHIDALLDDTRESHFFTKLNLSSSCHQLKVRATDRGGRRASGRCWVSSNGTWCRSVCRGLPSADARHEQGADRVYLPRIVGDGRGTRPQVPLAGLGPRTGPWGAAGPLCRCELVSMDACMVHSPTREQHLLDIAELLEIFRRRQLYAKSSKCEFGRSAGPAQNGPDSVGVAQDAVGAAGTSPPATTLPTNSCAYDASVQDRHPEPDRLIRMSRTCSGRCPCWPRLGGRPDLARVTRLGFFGKRSHPTPKRVWPVSCAS